MAERALQRFLLFTAPSRGGKKLFVSSFKTIDDAISLSEKIAGNDLYWQVVDTRSGEVVAEDMGHLE